MACQQTLGLRKKPRQGSKIYISFFLLPKFSQQPNRITSRKKKPGFLPVTPEKIAWKSSSMRGPRESNAWISAWCLQLKSGISNVYPVKGRRRKTLKRKTNFGIWLGMRKRGNEWIFGNPRTRKYRLRWRETFRTAESQYFGSGSTF